MGPIRGPDTRVIEPIVAFDNTVPIPWATMFHATHILEHDTRCSIHGTTHVLRACVIRTSQHGTHLEGHDHEHDRVP